MTSTFHFYCERDALPAVQQVVKQTGARFESNPFAWPEGLGKVRVVVSHDGDRFGDTVRGICAITDPPAPEKPPKRGWMSRMFGRLQGGQA